MKRRTGFTLIELLVVVAIIAVLISILLPSLTMARKYARSTQCEVALRQWGVGFHLYTEDYNGALPFRHEWKMSYYDPNVKRTLQAKDLWYMTVPKYLNQNNTDWQSINKLGCPEVVNTQKNNNYWLGYSMSQWLWDYARRMSRLERPYTNMLLIDFLGCSTCTYDDLPYWGPITSVPNQANLKGFTFFHGTQGMGKGTSCFLFADGRVGSATYEQLLGMGAGDAFWGAQYNEGTHYGS